MCTLTTAVGMTCSQIKMIKSGFIFSKCVFVDKRQSEVGKDGEIDLRDVLLVKEVYVGTRF